MDACQKAIDFTLERTGGRGGVILIDNKGELGYSFSTGTMAWAFVSKDGMKHGLRENENIKEKL